MNEEQQLKIEQAYSRKLIDGHIRDYLIGKQPYKAMLDRGVGLLRAFLKGEYYPSKNARLAQLHPMVLEDLVMDVLVQVCYCTQPQMFVSVSGQLASRLGFDDHRDSIMTMAEVLTVVCETDAYDIGKQKAKGSLMICNRIELPRQLTEAIEQSMYLPPMVSEPEELYSNFESPYLSFNDCLILGRHNEHSGDISLDIINRQNAIALSLNEEFLNTVPEESWKELDTAEKQTNWNVFVKQSADVYQLLLEQGNKFWLTNKVDKRGRLYAQGYHVSSQGTSYKKAMLELHQPEIVEGVPNET